jgi:hypothetical protein
LREKEREEVELEEERPFAELEACISKAAS